MMSAAYKPSLIGLLNLDSQSDSFDIQVFCDKSGDFRGDVQYFSRTSRYISAAAGKFVFDSQPVVVQGYFYIFFQ